MDAPPTTQAVAPDDDATTALRTFPAEPGEDAERPATGDATELERWQRNFAELLQELRVTQTGVQILFAFLLSLGFSSRFEEISRFERITYLVALLSAAGATAMIIAPVAHHRLLFRRGHKPFLVVQAHRLAMGGLGLMLVSVVSSVLLASGLVVARPVAVLVAAITGTWFVGIWGVAPWLKRNRDAADPAGCRVRSGPRA
jgi:hypothetical protein